MSLTDFSQVEESGLDVDSDSDDEPVFISRVGNCFFCQYTDAYLAYRYRLCQSNRRLSATVTLWTSFAKFVWILRMPVRYAVPRLLIPNPPSDNRDHRYFDQLKRTDSNVHVALKLCRSLSCMYLLPNLLFNDLKFFVPVSAVAIPTVKIVSSDWPTSI